MMLSVVILSCYGIESNDRMTAATRSACHVLKEDAEALVMTSFECRHLRFYSSKPHDVIKFITSNIIDYPNALRHSGCMVNDKK